MNDGLGAGLLLDLDGHCTLVARVLDEVLVGVALHDEAVGIQSCMACLGTHCPCGLATHNSICRVVETAGKPE